MFVACSNFFNAPPFCWLLLVQHMLIAPTVFFVACAVPRLLFVACTCLYVYRATPPVFVSWLSTFRVAPPSVLCCTYLHIQRPLACCLLHVYSNAFIELRHLFFVSCPSTYRVPPPCVFALHLLWVRCWAISQICLAVAFCVLFHAQLTSVTPLMFLVLVEVQLVYNYI